MAITQQEAVIETLHYSDNTTKVHTWRHGSACEIAMAKQAILEEMAIQT